MTQRTTLRQASTQVVVAGAGPVGLLLACELRRAQVPVIVVERLARPMSESRASQLTTLTAELLHERGFDALLDEAAPEPRAHFGGLSFDLSGMDSEYAGNWKVPQFRTEAVLGQRAAELGAIVLRDHELTEIGELPDHVVCGLRTPAGDMRIHAQYIVGCDGAGSTVRALCGFRTTATAPTMEMLRADVTGIEIRDRRFERLAGGMAVSSARDGVTRVMVHAAGQRVQDRTTPPRFPEVVRLWKQVTGEDISAGTAIWIDSFDNCLGQADAYRRGRVLLAGDAAHWHMPIGGQALNVGLQDAVNLGWKLAAAVDGWAPPQLLDSYHVERHPVAARVLRWVAAQEIVLFGGREIDPLRAVLSEIIGIEDARDFLAGVVSGLDDRYGTGDRALVGRRIANLPVGTTPVVVRLTPDGRADGFGVPAIRVDRSIPGVAAMLVRPDGYVAWAGDDEAELSLAIGQWFREKVR